MGEEFTAKDFRTWGATLQALKLLVHTALPDPATERAVKSAIVDVVRAVAAKLRNTPAVCRKSYINPVVFDAWRSGALQRAFSGGLKLEAARRRAEGRVLAFLARQAR